MFELGTKLKEKSLSEATDRTEKQWAGMELCSNWELINFHECFLGFSERGSMESTFVT